MWQTASAEIYAVCSRRFGSVAVRYVVGVRFFESGQGNRGKGRGPELRKQQRTSTFSVTLFVSVRTGRALDKNERPRFFAKNRVQEKERCSPFVAAATGAYAKGSYLVDPASSHMLVSKIKPCKCKYELEYSETANGSLNQLSFI